jgi:hypothetical protein
MTIHWDNLYDLLPPLLAGALIGLVVRLLITLIKGGTHAR